MKVAHQEICSSCFESSDPGVPTEVTSIIQRLTSSIVGRGGSKRANPEQATSSHQRRPRKERQPNWTQLEISALIQAKRIKFLEELDNQHEPSLMQRENTQWTQISAKVMEILSNQQAECVCDASAYKEKWGTLVVEYKKIYDHHKGIGTCSY
jgi:hypothetical protein